MAIIYQGNTRYRRVYSGNSRVKASSLKNIAEDMGTDYDYPSSYAIEFYVTDFPSDVSAVEVTVNWILYDTDGGETSGSATFPNIVEWAAMGTFETDNLCAIESFQANFIIKPTSDANKVKYRAGKLYMD